MLFEQWRDRFGWIIGALLIMTVVAIMISQPCPVSSQPCGNW